MTEQEFNSGWLGGKETSKLAHITSPYCQGYGVDLGCELDPHPNARILVDNEQIVHTTFMAPGQPVPNGVDPSTSHKYEVHIRNVEALFPDWSSETLDFVYSSHLIEHIRDPRGFLTECLRLIKPGGHVVVVGPHEDWYWPNFHPDANPDHNKYNWRLNQNLVSKWLAACGRGSVEIVLCEEYGWDQNNWSFVVVGKKLSQSPHSQSSPKGKKS